MSSTTCARSWDGSDGTRLRPLWQWLRRATVLALLGCGRLGVAEGVSLSVLLETRAASQRGLSLLLTRQRVDGSWAGDPLTTSQVLICLANAPSLVADARAAEAMAHAETYLKSGVLTACLASASGSEVWPLPGLAAALTALARRDSVAQRDVLAQGRALILSRVQAVVLADQRQGLAFAPSPGLAPEALATCAAVDALLLSEGLDPTWTSTGYAGVAATLHEALNDLLRASTAPAAGTAPGTTREIPAELAGATSAIARALLALGARPDAPPLATVLDRLARRPPAVPAAAFSAAEALRLAAVATPGWRERQAEALLGTQQGDGGWAGSGPDEPRDHSTALALRCLQVALGRHLDTVPTP
jgi:hypothetical protein